MKGFIEFISEQGVVGLAIGFILGGAVSKLVASLVNDIINPIIAAIFGSADGMAELMLGPVKIGAFASTMIDFLIIAAVVYFGFKGLKLDRLDKKKS
jgi:large conductance mechanosensitive channel